jgi:hypothetical protein
MMARVRVTQKKPTTPAGRRNKSKLHRPQNPYGDHSGSKQKAVPAGRVRRGTITRGK